MLATPPPPPPPRFCAKSENVLRSTQFFFILQAPWADLPLELLSKIASGQDALKPMLLVCKSWAQGYEGSVSTIHVQLDAAIPMLKTMPQIQRFELLRSLHLTGDLQNTGLQCLRGSRVRSLVLSDCQGVSSALLETLRGTQITKLSMFGCWEVGDECMETLAGLGLSVSGLFLAGCCVGDLGLEALRGLKSLSSLRFMEFDTSRVTGAGFRALRALPLTSLEVGGDEEHGDPFEDDFMDFDSVKELRGLPLTHLWINGSGWITNEGFSGLEGMPLTSLEVSQCCTGFSDAALFSLQGMPLQSLCLEVDGSEYMAPETILSSDAFVRVLGAMPLTMLDLSGPFEILPESLQALPGTLTSLHLSGHGKFSDRSLSIVRELPLLTDLHLFGCAEVTDQGFKSLVGLPLKKLHLCGCEAVTSEALASLKGLPLTELWVSKCNLIDDEGVKCLAGLPLTALALFNCGSLTNESLRLLRGLPLADLHLGGCGLISDKGLAELVGSAVSELHLDGCSSVTVAGFKSLSALPLTKLSLFFGDNVYSLCDIPKVIAAGSHHHFSTSPSS